MVRDQSEFLPEREGDEISIQGGHPVGDGVGLALTICGSSEEGSRIALLSYPEARRLAVRLMTAAEDGEAADHAGELQGLLDEQDALRSIAGTRMLLAMPELVSPRD